MDDLDEATRNIQIMVNLNTHCTHIPIDKLQAIDFIPIIHVKQG